MIGTTKKRNTYKGKKNSLAEKRFIAGKMPSAGKAPDYRQTAFDRRAMIISIILYLSIDAVVSALFFRTAAAFAFLLPGVFQRFQSRPFGREIPVAENDDCLFRRSGCFHRR